MIQTTYDHMTPLGVIRMSLIDDELIEMSFVEDKTTYPQHPVLSKLIDNYFDHGTPIKYPVRFTSGTKFQKKVWNALLTIPLGELRTYAGIAEQIGHPTAFRAVGQACKRNPIGLVVPCHRVVGSDGKLTGYSGKDYIWLKEKLLNHELFLHVKKSF